MAGNSKRQGATRKGASRKGPSAGSGGQRRQGLEPKGPTPKASERDKHPAARRSRAVAKKADAASKAAPRSGAGARGRGPVRTRKDGSELVYGRNSVVEALRAEIPATTLYIQQFVDSDERIREILTLAGARRLPLLESPRSELDKISAGGIHQGVALAVPAYEYSTPSDLLHVDAPGATLIVALDGVTDPRNLGAVVRSAAAFGAHGVVVPERRAAGMTASAWKSSAGAAARMPIARATNLTRTLISYKKSGAMVVGLDAEGESLDTLDPELLTGPLVIVLGSEGDGLSRLVRETCDVVVGIPMSGVVESLNAGVAAGVTLYAVSRARARA